MIFSNGFESSPQPPASHGSQPILLLTLARVVAAIPIGDGKQEGQKGGRGLPSDPSEDGTNDAEGDIR